MKENNKVWLVPHTKTIPFIKSATDWSHRYYNIQAIHDKGFKGQGIKAAVIDTGIDFDHSCFREALAEGRLSYFDKREGNKNEPKDFNSHGTWCASRFIGTGSVKGFSPKVELVSIKSLNDNGSGTLVSIKQAVESAILDHKVDVISTSIGWAKKASFMDSVVQLAKEKGVFWFSAAGNDGTREDIDYPALYNYIWSVGSHGSYGNRSSFSDFGVALDFYGSGDKTTGAFTRNRVGLMSGTSMATPSTAALFCLILSELKKKYGKIDRKLMKKIVECH